MQAGEGQGVAPYNHHVNLTSSYFLLKCVPSRDGGATQGFEANDPPPQFFLVLLQAKYSDLVDNACGYDGWVAASLPVEK
jgi:hypothetical protein